MRFLFAVLLLMAGSAMAQNLGRLPGTIYPADRGARTDTTLSTIKAAHAGGLEWYIDGTWEIANDFSFRTNDVIRLLPGAKFNIAPNTTLSFAGAEFWAAKQRCFTGGGTTDGQAKYPHQFAEWSGGWSYNMPLGYLDPPYEFTQLVDDATHLYTNAFKSAAGTNLAWILKYIDDHIDDYGEQGYASTNDVNIMTNSLNSLSNSLTASLSNNLVANSNLVESALSNIVAVGFVSTNTALQIISGSSAELIYSTPGVIYTNGAGWTDSQYTAPSDGIYMFGFRFDYSHAAVTSAGDRLIVKLYIGGSQYSTMHRHGLAYGGTETVVSGELPVRLSAGDVVTIRAVRDGSAAMTNSIGAATTWGFKVRN